MDDDFNISQFSQTPVKQGVGVPPGHIVIAEKWRGSDLVKQLQAFLKVMCQGPLGVIDFHMSSKMSAIYLTEADLQDNSYRKRIVRAKKIDAVNTVVVANISLKAQNEHLPTLQQFIVIDLGMTLLPVSDIMEAVGILVQLVYAESQYNINPFRIHPKLLSTDASLLNTLQLVPNLGQIKVQALLTKYRTIQAICNAPVEDLAKIIGKSNAVKLVTFFHS